MLNFLDRRLHLWIAARPLSMLHMTWALLAAGAVLRISGFTASAIWYDESYTWALVRLPLFTMVRTAGLDFSPPLWDLLVWPLARLPILPELALRLPALAASLLGLWLAWQVIQRWLSDRREQALALLGVALLPYQFWMAQDGRTYALLSALYLGAIYFAQRGRWLGLTACCGLMLYSHNTGGFYAITALAVSALCDNWIWTGCFPEIGLRRAAMSGSAALTGFVFWLPAVWRGMHEPYWLGSLSTGILNTGLFRIIFAGALASDAWIWLGLVTIALSIATAGFISAWWMWKNDDRPLALLGLTAIGPLLFMVIAAVVKNVIFYRPLSPLAAPLAIWVAVCLSRLSWRPLRWFFAYNWLLLLSAALIGWSPTTKGGELRDLAARIAQDDGPGVVIYHATGTSLLPFEIYLPDARHILLDENQGAGLLSNESQAAFGVERAPLEDIPHVRAYVVFAKDANMTPRARTRMEHYIQGGVLLGTVHYWQAAPIEVWEVP